ncbi:MAG: endonuclease/exonuclease/phosphatase family protein [Akkermansiaceae bacterium]|nr:endonuclease/exonuclease/phosphatase family protein [Akkermansiaceae bacterium]
MNKQLAGILCMGLTVCLSSKAKPIEGSTETAPRGIHVVADTRLRVVCYNAYWTSIFPRDDGEVRTSQWIDGKGIDGEARLRRFAAWAPKAQADLWVMQEVIYSEEDQKDTTAEAIGRYFGKITGQTWHAAADGRGRLILSRHPVLWSGAIRNARGMAALINLPDDLGDDFLMINLHFFTKPREVQIKQATRALDFIDSVREGGRPEIPKETPIMICGDFNSLPSERPYHILAKLARDAQEGDGKVWHYHNSKPRQLNSEARGTFGEVSWSGEVGTSTPQPPTRTIDHILVPKGFMAIQQAFVFNSLILPENTLAQYGVAREAILLSREGRVEKIDHLPVFMDLK